MSKKGLIFFILSIVSSAVLGQDYKVDTSNAKQVKNPPPMVGASPFVGQTVEEIQKAQTSDKPAPNVKKQDVNYNSKANNTNGKNKISPKTKKANPNSTNSTEALNSNNTGTTNTTSEQEEGTTGRSSSHSAEGDFNRGY